MYVSLKGIISRKGINYMKGQIKGGAIVSYFNIVLNMAISMFFTPFLISSLGASEYGVYKIVQSFSGQLSIMSFGISILIVRNLVYYEEKKQRDEKENFLFFALLASYILCVAILAVGAVMFFMIDGMYQNSLTAEELIIAKKLFVLLILNIALTVICDSYLGIIRAHEQFVIAYGFQTLKLVMRISIMIILLNAGVKSVGIVLADCLVSAIMWILSAIYGRHVLKEKPKFHYWDKALIFQCISFSAAIFLQAIVNQVNQNLDNVILGIMTNARTVTMYSLSLSLFTSFNSMVSVVGGLFTPKATRLVAQNADGDRLTDFVVRPGRVQLMLAGLAISGFILFGRNFIYIWVGDTYQEVYFLTILLLISSVIPLVETVTTSILDALLKRMGRSVILIAMCMINIIVSVVLIRKIGYWGAAIGTAISFIVGHGILLNIYLKRVASLKIKKMFSGIVNRIFPAIVLATVVGIPVSFLPNTMVGFLLKVCIYCMIYLVIMYFIGMNTSERDLCRSFVTIINKRKR